MAIITEDQIIGDTLIDIANQMMIAARTAPKTRGYNNLVFAIITGDDIKKISEKMKEIGERTKMDFFIRDAANVLQSHAILLLGAKIKTTDLSNCNYCGTGNCTQKEKSPDVPCAFNNIDLGIALGSAVSVAALHHADNRIMFSVGKAAIELGILAADALIVIGIPLSSTSKNPFFDRG